jgi:hypothetical protein
MTEAILKFNLTPSDEFDFYCATHGYDYFLLITELDNELRDRIKYQSEKYSSKELKAYQEIRDWIVDYCIENSLKSEMD